MKKDYRNDYPLAEVFLKTEKYKFLSSYCSVSYRWILFYKYIGMPFALFC